VDVVVSLLTTGEIEEFGLAEEVNSVRAGGMEFVSLPVSDRGVPESNDQFAEIVARLGDLIAAGKVVGIHCRAGIGRSALLAASLLIASGLSPADAFERIRIARGAPVPDTPGQRAWVEQFAEDYVAKTV
jgi:protein-tyrosine phosphatase